MSVLHGLAYEEEDVFEQKFLQLEHSFFLAQLKAILHHYHGISPLHCLFTLNRAQFGEVAAVFLYY